MELKDLVKAGAEMGKGKVIQGKWVQGLRLRVKGIEQGSIFP